MTFCIVVTTCEECGPMIEAYGPFDTEVDAKEFNIHGKVPNSIVGMNCARKKIVEMNKRSD